MWGAGTRRDRGINQDWATGGWTGGPGGETPSRKMGEPQPSPGPKARPEVQGASRLSATFVSGIEHQERPGWPRPAVQVVLAEHWGQKSEGIEAAGPQIEEERGWVQRGRVLEGGGEALILSCLGPTPSRGQTQHDGQSLPDDINLALSSLT